MPYVSDQTVDACNRTLQGGDPAAIKAMLTTNPVLPPSGGISLAELGRVGARFDEVVKLDYSKLKIDSAANSIKFIKLRPVTQNEIGAMTFALKSPAELPDKASRIGWTAVWWLPWQNSHIVKVKIRSLKDEAKITIGGNAEPVDNPAIFFTAAINGCSVFAVGDSKAPQMYHGGVDGPMNATTRGSDFTEAAWRRLIGRHNTTKNVQGVGKTDYISELLPNAQKDMDRTGNSTTLSRALEAELESRLINNGRLTRIFVNPWGMVFGARGAGGDWTMTLVKNAFVSYHRLTIVKSKLFGKKKEVISGESRTVRSYNSSGDLVTESQGTDQSIAYCYALGYQDFFPGTNQTVLHDLSQVTLY